MLYLVLCFLGIEEHGDVMAMPDGTNPPDSGTCCQSTTHPLVLPVVQGILRSGSVILKVT